MQHQVNKRNEDDSFLWREIHELTIRFERAHSRYVVTTFKLGTLWNIFFQFNFLTGSKLFAIRLINSLTCWNKFIIK